MTDIPTVPQHKATISTFGLEGLGVPLAVANINASVGSAAWSTANLAKYMPFTLTGPFLARAVWWGVGGAGACNIDAGVYTEDGVKLFSSGATAIGSASLTQVVTLGTPVLLGPGSYFFAMSVSATSAFIEHGFTDVAEAKMNGMAQQATAHPLPATATFATIATAGAIPLMGISSKTVI